MIRLGTFKDLPAVTEVYRAARRYMAENGNSSQWGDGYPSEELTGKDIANGNLYVIETGGKIAGVFVFIIGDEPNYARIEDGEWKNDDPYGTIHRLASNGTAKGVFKMCFDHCRKMWGNIRIDTHADNGTMLGLIEKSGFEKCGTIYVEDGTPRTAFQFTDTK